jgi:hypothetical protein
VDSILELAHTEDNLRFYHVRFNETGNQCLWDVFFRKINELIVPYCLDRKEFAHLSPDVEKRAKGFFVKSPTTGEPAELILYFLTEGVMGAPKIFSKMANKLNVNDYVKGADGVHLGIINNQFYLLFGESKMYQKSGSAISEALKSMEGFLGDETKKDHELYLIRKNIDIPNPMAKKYFLNMLNPYKPPLAEALVCFIGFDFGGACQTCSSRSSNSECMKAPCSINKAEFVAQYKAKTQECITKTRELVAKSALLKAQQIYFFFLPFTLVEKYRSKFLEVVR